MKLEFLFAEDEKSERQRFVHKYNNYIPADARVSTHGVSLHMKSSICYLNNELDHNAQESPQTGYITYTIHMQKKLDGLVQKTTLFGRSRLRAPQIVILP